MIYGDTKILGIFLEPCSSTAGSSIYAPARSHSEIYSATFDSASGIELSSAQGFICVPHTVHVAFHGGTARQRI